MSVLQSVSQNKVDQKPQSEFIHKLNSLWQQKRFVCVGLDSDWDKIPASLKKNFDKTNIADVMFAFNQSIIDATAQLVCAYKPNVAFYEARGERGLTALLKTVQYIKTNYPDIPVILDAKRADIGSTNNGYARFAFDYLGVDAITVHPYLGKEALQPFLDRTDKGIIVLVRTSNPGAGEFQDLLVSTTSNSNYENREPLYLKVARSVTESWNANGNCLVVVGATYPQELARVRAVIGEMPILIPGVGAQGGDIQATVEAGKAQNSWGMIINSSRGIIFASEGNDYAQSARLAVEKLNSEIAKYS